MSVGVIQVVRYIMTVFFCIDESHSIVGIYLPFLLLMDIWDVESSFYYVIFLLFNSENFLVFIIFSLTY